MNYNECRKLEMYRAAVQDLKGYVYCAEEGVLSCSRKDCAQCTVMKSCDVIIAVSGSERTARFLMFNSEHG